VAIKAIEFHDEAAAEYDAAFDWYLNRSSDAARQFDIEFDRALTHIGEGPRRWAFGPFNTRRYLLRHFPFLLVYRELPSGNVQILALAHTSRRPGYWKHRI
jgi:toxin ParE1/3/4